MLQVCSLDQNGNRSHEYATEIREKVQERAPRTFVEVGVGVGATLLEVYLNYSNCSYLGVDLFRRKGPVDQLEEFLANIRGKHIHSLKAPGVFPAQAYNPDHLDIVHLDVLDPGQSNPDHLVRTMITAWWPKTKMLILPREEVYVYAMADIASPEFGDSIACYVK